MIYRFLIAQAIQRCGELRHVLSQVVALLSYRVQLRAECRDLRPGVGVCRTTVVRHCRDCRIVVADVDVSFAVDVRHDNVALLDATLDRAPGYAELVGCLIDGELS